MSRDSGGLGLGGDAPPIQLTPRGGLDDPAIPLPSTPPRDPKPEPSAPAFPNPLPGIGSQPLGTLPGTPVTLPAPKKPGGGQEAGDRRQETGDRLPWLWCTVAHPVSCLLPPAS
jgi:hypothetical protein